MRTELQHVNGRLCVCLDGQPHPGLFCSTPTGHMHTFIEAGFDVFDTHPGIPHGWVGPGEYDYAATDECIEGYLRQKPDALLILRLWMGHHAWQKPVFREPFWWCAAHPDQASGTIPAEHDHPNKLAPSFASRRWRADAGETIRRAVQHIERRYGDRIFAYVPGGGPCGEWFHWFSYYTGPDGAKILEDDSEPMRSAFVEHCRAKYGDLDALNRAWETKLTDWNAIAPASPDERASSRMGHLRALPAEARIVDWYECYNRQVADTLVDWAAAAKAGCDRRKLVLAFYGYLWHHQPNVPQARCGHVDLEPVLACGDVDAIVAPTHYSFRQTEGVISGQAPVGGALLRGRQYVHELDDSTHRKPCWPCRDHNLPADANETEQILLRNLARVLTQGSTAWFMDLVGGMYDEPALVEALRRVLRVGRAHALSAGRNNRQAAVVLNPADPYYYREAEPLLTPMVAMWKQFELSRMGLDFDDLTLDDLLALNPEQTEQYRLWIFPSAVHLDDRQVEAIARHCQRNGNHVLWTYGVGVAGGDRPDLARMRRITGFDCGVTFEGGEAVVRARASDDLPAGLTYGTRGDLSPEDIRYHAALRDYPDSPFDIRPRFWIENANSPLGLAEDLPGGDRAGLARRGMGDWTSLLSVAPLLPRVLLRRFAADAGCHVYTDFDAQTMHCDGYLGIYFHATGRCTLHWPSEGRITDIVSGQVLAERARSVHLDADINSTRILRHEARSPAVTGVITRS